MATVKELRDYIRDHRKVHCPPLSKAKKEQLAKEVLKYGVSEKSASEMKLKDLKAEVKKYRAVHCPKLSGLNKTALHAEVKKLGFTASEKAPVKAKRVKKVKAPVVEVPKKKFVLKKKEEPKPVVEVPKKKFVLKKKEEPKPVVEVPKKEKVYFNGKEFHGTQSELLDAMNKSRQNGEKEILEQLEYRRKQREGPKKEEPAKKEPKKEEPKKEEPKKEDGAIQAYTDFLKGSIKEDSGKTTKGVFGNFTKTELAQFEKIIDDGNKELRNLKGDRGSQLSLKKKINKTITAFKKEVNDRYFKKDSEGSKLKEASDMAKGIVKKEEPAVREPYMASKEETMDLIKRLSGNKPEPKKEEEPKKSIAPVVDVVKELMDKHHGKSVDIIDSEEEENEPVGKEYSYDKKFYDAIDKMFSITTARTQSVRGREVDKDLFDTIYSIQKNYDLYPTPNGCIKHISDDFFKLMKSYHDGKEHESYEVNILEPSAGTGAIIRDIIDLNGKVMYKGRDKRDIRFKIDRLDAVEMSDALGKKLKEHIKLDTVYRDDFLKVKDLGKNNYNLIVMNPPYSDGTDKKAYLYHIMKAMSILAENKDNYTYLYFIVPTTYFDDLIKKGFGNTATLNETVSFDIENLPNLKNIAEKSGLTLNDDGDGFEEFHYGELTKIAECKDFAKLDNKGRARPLGITTGIYRMENIR